MPRVLVRAKRLNPAKLSELVRRHQAPFYRRAGLCIAVGFEAVHDVTFAQLGTLQADGRLEVEIYAGDGAGFPRAVPAGDWFIPNTEDTAA